MLVDSIFSQWGLSEETLRSISDLGYENPTPVQAACIPHLLKNSSDLLALAKTGTGKTAAFGIPLVEKLTATPELQALVLCPTRELATQVAQNLQGLGQRKGIKVTTVLGGESYRKQIDALRRNPQILVSTPGRLIDLMEQKVVKLNTIKYLILDEADEMLSFGFQEALETIWEQLQSQPVNTWLFSATMSDSIKRLTSKYLHTPYEVALNTHTENPRVKSYAAVVYEEDKIDALCLLLKNTPEFYGIIFAQTKKQVAELEIKLRSLGLAVDSLHGDKVQADRTRVITRMKRRELQILVATDVAARGLDIEDLTHVVNFEIPWDAETYTHRIGRTARAGKTGIVWTLVRPKEAHQLRKFERALKSQFEALKIPSVMDVRKNQIKAWLKAVNETEVSSKNAELFEQIAVDLQAEESFVLSPAAREWMFKAMEYSKIGADFEGHQPRSFDLRPRDDSSGRRAHDGEGRGAGRSSGGYRGRDGGGRSERSERPRSDRYADRPRRSRSSDESSSSSEERRPRASASADGAERRPRAAASADGGGERREESRRPARSESEGRPRFRTSARSSDGGESRPARAASGFRRTEDRPGRTGTVRSGGYAAARGERGSDRSERGEGRRSLRDRYPRKSHD